MDNTSLQVRMKRLFTEGFMAIDIAEPLASFDTDKCAIDTLQFMNKNNLEVVGVRRDGVVAGYVQQQDLTGGKCGDHMHYFDKGIVLAETSFYPEVIDCLSRSRYCFISVLGSVGAVITRNDIQKPPVRMWLFGMVTIVEMFIARTIEIKYPQSTWQKELSPERLKKAEDLQDERKRRNQHVTLLDCLQLGDKAKIIMKDPEMREDMGFETKRIAEKASKDFESLRNNLAHAQDIITYNWDSIVVISRRLNKIMTRI
ncbi:MAG: hypothetical protein ACYSTS_10975 [Planctomycetota bacterium]